MHTIEPYYKWLDEYSAARDERSPFYRREYDQFKFHQKIYNYLIHPQWDDFGSDTLFIKILYANYHLGYAILEFIGEWDDCLKADFMTLKHKILNPMMQHGVHQYVLICENVLNYHGGENDYYEELQSELIDMDGWICMMNVQEHVRKEQIQSYVHHYVNLDDSLQDFNWRKFKPDHLYLALDRHLRQPRLQHR